MEKAPPTKRELTSWWNVFRKNQGSQKTALKAPDAAIFGVALQTSIPYANVAISLTDAEGNHFIYGYVPIVVAKCGIFLKERATDVEGIFRKAGNLGKIKDLQEKFESAQFRYGKGLDWTDYTVHDAANVLRRYLNQLPEPVIPLEFYQRCRDPIRGAPVHTGAATARQVNPDFNLEGAIQTYQKIITELPPLNRQLLLYILDLLAVFASKSDVNLMTASNLASIFTPGILRHPDHDQAPDELLMSIDVIIFLIENQDHFLFGMQGTAADEKTIKDIQSGTPSNKLPSTPASAKSRLVGRSASVASAGSESARRLAGIRRGASISSKASRQSGQSNGAPGSPYASSHSGSVHRSNTVPSKKSQSPALVAKRFEVRGRDRDLPSSPIAGVASSPMPSPLAKEVGRRESPRTASDTRPSERSPHLRPSPVEARKSSKNRTVDEDRLDLPVPNGMSALGQSTPSKERSFSSIFKQSPGSDAERDGRKPKKLQKKRLPGAVPGAHDSSQSLVAEGLPATSVPGTSTQFDGSAGDSQTPTTRSDAYLTVADAGAVRSPSPVSPATPIAIPNPRLADASQHESATTLKARASPRNSLHSRSTIGDFTDSDAPEAANSLPIAQEEKKRRWRISVSPNKRDKETKALGSSLPRAEQSMTESSFGSLAGAERSMSSVGSFSRPSKAGMDQSSSSRVGAGTAAYEGPDDDTVTAGIGERSEKKGPIGWFRGKLKEREAAKERARSPPPTLGVDAAGQERASSKQSLNAVLADASIEGGESTAGGTGIGAASGL